MGTFTNRDSIIEIAKYVPKTNSFVRNGTIDRTLLGRKDTSLTAEGFTLVNLLGSYGGFEKDSNGDGLADGWNQGGSTDYETYSIGNNQQKIALDMTGNTGTRFAQIWRGVNFELYQHKIFMNVGYTSDISSSLVILSWVIQTSGTGKNIYFMTSAINATSTIKMAYQTITITEFLITSINYFIQSTNTSGTVNVSFYQPCIYDITWMDQYSPMPQSLQEKYSVSKWVDMTDDDLANELPYVNSVGYVGVGL